MISKRLCLAATLCAWTGFASAHTGADGQISHHFWEGLAHPMLGLDHLAALVAVGLWGATAPRRSWMAPASFLLALLTGTFASSLSIAAHLTIEPMIAASLLVLGLLLATEKAAETWVGCALVSFFGLFHGFAHSVEIQGHPARVGLLISSAVLLAVAYGLGQWTIEKVTKFSKISGGVIASFGLLATMSLWLA